MSSAAFLPFTDEQERLAAIDPRRSFTVQAPAGSGKTELLIQRFLSLLAVVEKPEAIVAITFTRKAAGEMRERILRALRDAASGVAISKPHEERTRALAASALRRNAELKWDLLGHPGRLRVETIDALCMSITGSMPWLARFGAMPGIQDENNTEPYDEAARLTILEIDRPGEYAEALETLLGHLDNDAVRLRDLIAAMLRQREQWIDLAFARLEDERHLLNDTLSRVASREIESIETNVPAHLRPAWLALANLTHWPDAGDVAAWVKLKDAVVSSSKTWRKKDVDLSLIAQLSDTPGLLEDLLRTDSLPPARYLPEQWTILEALFCVLRLAVGQLRQVFREQGSVDFSEISQAARRALQESGNPTELAYRLDSRIDHLLIDEFQDTSRGQFDLISQLTSGWMPDDGRTLFLVGDPMQSIYRFRQAEVGLFLRVCQDGIGSLRPQPLQLSSNYRTSRRLLGRINEVCEAIFPKHAEESIETGRISFTPCFPDVPDEGGEWKLHVLESPQQEAARVVHLVRSAQMRDPNETVAILVRARSHLVEIVPALKEAGLAFQAVDVDSLASRPVVQDLLSLTRALLHPGDRISWLAILRAPWCGLTLPDLEALVAGRAKGGVWEYLQTLDSLSADGQRRAGRLRHAMGIALEKRTHWTLRKLVEKVWVELGGPACLAGKASALQDASDFLDLLEKEQIGGDLRDFDRFPELVKKLFSRPDPAASEKLQVMTIHQAKGLEFDTVIVPGIERTTDRDEMPMFLFHTWPGQDREERLIAPLPATAGEDDAVYKYLQRVEKEKGNYERLRMFYVAITRAKKYLHLIGLPIPNQKGEIRGKSGSFYNDLRDVIQTEDLAQSEIPSSARGANGAPQLSAGAFRRLPEGWSAPELPAPLIWDGAGPRRTEPHDPTFEWVGETLRIAGTVVHAYLQRMRTADAPIPVIEAIRGALIHAGLSTEEVPAAASRVQKALEQTRASERGRWILDAHSDARAEYSVTGSVNGEIIHGKIDRTFVDADGTRWIVDFKTSVHLGTDLDGFLGEQQRRYHDQMSRYASILAPLGNPVRLGLYFPLLDQWREWDPTQPPV